MCSRNNQKCFKNTSNKSILTIICLKITTKRRAKFHFQKHLIIRTCIRSKYGKKFQVCANLYAFSKQMSKWEGGIYNDTELPRIYSKFFDAQIMFVEDFNRAVYVTLTFILTTL